jgi:hypothetical protein
VIFGIIRSELKNANMADYYIEINDEKELEHVTKSISALSPFVNLRKLNLVCCNGITDILVLSTPVNLIKLNLSFCMNITGISVLASSVSMRYQSRILKLPRIYYGIPSHEI